MDGQWAGGGGHVWEGGRAVGERGSQAVVGRRTASSRMCGWSCPGGQKGGSGGAQSRGTMGADSLRKIRIAIEEAVNEEHAGGAGRHTRCRKRRLRWSPRLRQGRAAPVRSRRRRVPGAPASCAERPLPSRRNGGGSAAYPQPAVRALAVLRQGGRPPPRLVRFSLLYSI